METLELPSGAYFATLTPANGLASRSLEALHAHLAATNNKHHACFVRGFSRPREAAPGTPNVQSPVASSHRSFETTTTEADLLSDEGPPIGDHGCYVLSFHRPVNPALGWVMGSGKFEKDPTNGCVDLLLCQPETASDASYHEPLYPRHVLFRHDHLGRIWLIAKHNRVALNGIDLAMGERRLLGCADMIEISGLKFSLQFAYSDEQRLSHKAALDVFLAQQYPEPPPDVTSATPSQNDVQIGEWIVHGVVGKTPTSIIEAASHRRIGQAVAVKRMVRTPETARKVNAELAIYERLLPKLQQHEYGEFVMKKYDLLDAGQGSVLVHDLYLLWTPLARMDLNAFRYSPAYKSSTDEVKLQLFCQALLGTQALHDIGWIHRDLKPHNIAVVSLKPPHVVIIDFGGAIESSEKCIPTPRACGTLGYLAPELENNAYAEKYGQKVDVWSMGAVGVFLILLGRIPWSYEVNIFLMSSSEAAKQTFLNYRRELEEHPSSSIRGLLAQMLNVYPKSRPDMRTVLAHPALQVPYKASKEFLAGRKNTGSKRRIA